MNHFRQMILRAFGLSVLSVGLLAPMLCHGHFWQVHEKITDSACQSSDGLQTFLSEYLEANSLTASYQVDGDGMFNNTVSYTPSMWLQCGSIMEDEELYYVLGIDFTLRVMDHFYDLTPDRAPGRVIGLNDSSEPWIDFIGWLPGHLTNSFVWASTTVPGPTAFGTAVGTNLYNWQCARAFEYAALTSTNQSDRNANMALMFYALGHILHLNQDTSSPDHGMTITSPRLNSRSSARTTA